MSIQLPRQDIPEKDKDPKTEKGKKWFQDHLDFAEHLLKNNNGRVQKMSRMYDSYNGKTEADSVRYLVSTYGRKNRSKYIPYRISKTKLDILEGEFLKMPLNATIKTINSDAVSEKMAKYELMLGAMHAKKELEKLREVGVDVLNGMPIPDKDDPSAFKSISFKDKNESVMQIMLKEIIKELSVHRKLSKNLQDCTITSMSYGKIAINELTGDMDYEPWDPRDAIFMKMDRDPFMEKSPIMGGVKRVPINQILTSYRLTDEQRTKLENIRNNPSEYLQNQEYRSRYRYVGGEFCADVMHIEWKGVRPKYSKITPRTNKQMEFDDSIKEHETSLSPEEYENNEEQYKKKQEKGEVKVVTEWEEDQYEATRIGHDIEVNLRRKPFIMRDEDTGKILGSSYCGLIFNEVDGETISLKEICENFDNVFDILMYQILREINKAKGKVIVYDRAGLPKKTTVKNVLYNALNDSFIDVDSSAAGNMAGKDLNISQIFKEIDLGVSNSFPFLLQMKTEIIQLMDTITGIHGAREGNIKASATVANSMQSVEASNTITEPLFYYFTKFSENVMMRLIETGKLVWGLYQPNKARMVLGDEKFKFLQLTQSIAFASYRAELVNPRWEQQIRQRMQQLAEISLNAKELRPQDLLDFELSETLADAKGMLKKAWNEINKMRMLSAQQQMMADAENSEKALQTQLQLRREDREDKQLNEKENITLKGKTDIAVNTAKQRGDLLLDQNVIDNEQE